MITILVVDDEEMIRTMLKQALEREGYNVLLAENGPKGISLVQNNQIDLVITDIAMPGMDGNELCEKIKEKSPFTKIIGMSGTPWLMDDNLFVHAFTKPFPIKDVCDKVRELLA